MHFFLILAACLHELAWLIANGYTVLPSYVEDYGKRIEWSADAVLGRTLRLSNPLRQILTTYLHGAGIDGGYAFFAPNVPNSYKVVFEIRYPNGEVEYDLPHISRSATAVRLCTLFDYIARADNDVLREVILKMLTYHIVQEHPSATTIRTILGYIVEPSAAEARKGKKEGYKVLYAYEFSVSSAPAK